MFAWPWALSAGLKFGRQAAWRPGTIGMVSSSWLAALCKQLLCFKSNCEGLSDCEVVTCVRVANWRVRITCLYFLCMLGKCFELSLSRAVKLLGGEWCLGLGLVLPGVCSGFVWPSKCLAAGQTDFVGSYWASLALFGCLAVWWWANCSCGVCVGGRRSG